jgi:hypothetical protein
VQKLDILTASGTMIVVEANMPDKRLTTSVDEVVYLNPSAGDERNNLEP